MCVIPTFLLVLTVIVFSLVKFLQPNIPRMKAKGDIQGLIQSLAYWIYKNDDSRLLQTIEALEALNWKPANKEQSAIVAYAHQDWKSLINLGISGKFYKKHKDRTPALDTILWAWQSQDAEFIVSASSKGRLVGVYTDNAKAYQETWELKIDNRLTNVMIARA